MYLRKVQHVVTTNSDKNVHWIKFRKNCSLFLLLDMSVNCRIACTTVLALPSTATQSCIGENLSIANSLLVGSRIMDTNGKRS